MDSANAVRDGDQFARLLGIELIESSPGQAKVRLAIRDRHRNGLGMVHGGVIFSLADYAFAVACNSHGYASVAIDASISFLKAPKGSVLRAEATEAAVEGKLGSCLVRVFDEDDSLVAVFKGLSYRKTRPEQAH